MSGSVVPPGVRSPAVTVLLTSVGRQVHLVEAFQQANCRVVATDCDELAAGLAVADRGFVSPPFTDPAFRQWLLRHCGEQSIDGLISLHTDELAVIQGFRKELQAIGVHVLGMPMENLERCIDKSRLHEVSEGTGFVVPRTWDVTRFDEISADAYPLVVKAVAGRGSRGLAFASDAAELAAHLRKAAPGTWLAQEFVQGVEYGVDLVNDLEGTPRAVLQRKKARMRNGETDIAETVSDTDISLAGKRLAARLQHSGLVDTDIIQSPEGLFLLDVNPRFGGGYIFNHEAGANVPAAIVAWLAGNIPDPEVFSYTVGVTHARVSTLQRIR